MLFNSVSISPRQVNDLSQVPVPVMLLPDDFKASSKIKVNNHLFNKYDPPDIIRRRISASVMVLV